MSPPTVQIKLRIPGNWAHPGELIERLPTGYRLSPDRLCMPDGQELELVPMPPDEQFVEIFHSSCRGEITRAERAVLKHYTVNLGLVGPGGSMEAARTMLRAGAALVSAGAAGVFIDNCALAHGGEHWRELAEDASVDAVTFAFAALVRNAKEVWSLGLHAMGQPDVVMSRADCEADDPAIIGVLGYLCEGERTIGDGHLLGDENGPQFQARIAPPDDFPADSPLHNPFGRLRLVNIRDAASAN